MIVVELIHPIRKEAVQSWTFDESQQTSVRIGRSRRNDIALLSGVVSREHAMLKFEGGAWNLQSLGTNGCFVDDRLVKSAAVSDGEIFRIARTGPRLRVRLTAATPTDPRSPQSQRARLERMTTPPRSRLTQEEVTTARETWMGPAGSSYMSIRRPQVTAAKEEN